MSTLRKLPFLGFFALCLLTSNAWSWGKKDKDSDDDDKEVSVAQPTCGPETEIFFKKKMTCAQAMQLKLPEGKVVCDCTEEYVGVEKGIQVIVGNKEEAPEKGKKHKKHK